MTWIKISEGVYQKQIDPNPTEIVRLDDLQKQIAELQEEIDNLKSKLLTYPDGASEELKEAIDSWNGMRHADIEMFQIELDEKEKLYNTLKGI